MQHKKSNWVNSIIRAAEKLIQPYEYLILLDTTNCFQSLGGKKDSYLFWLIHKEDNQTHIPPFVHYQAKIIHRKENSLFLSKLFLDIPAGVLIKMGILPAQVHHCAPSVCFNKIVISGSTWGTLPLC